MGEPDLFPDETGRIVRNAGIRFGEPCIKGTPIPVSVIQSRLGAGETPEAIAKDYEVKVEDVEAARVYKPKSWETRMMNEAVEAHWHRVLAKNPNWPAPPPEEPTDG